MAKYICETDSDLTPPERFLQTIPLILKKEISTKEKLGLLMEKCPREPNSYGREELRIPIIDLFTGGEVRDALRVTREAMKKGMGNDGGATAYAGLFRYYSINIPVQTIEQLADNEGIAMQFFTSALAPLFERILKMKDDHAFLVKSLGVDNKDVVRMDGTNAEPYYELFLKREQPAHNTVSNFLRSVFGGKTTGFGQKMNTALDRSLFWSVLRKDDEVLMISDQGVEDLRRNERFKENPIMLVDILGTARPNGGARQIPQQGSPPPRQDII